MESTTSEDGKSKSRIKKIKRKLKSMFENTIRKVGIFVSYHSVWCIFFSAIFSIILGALVFSSSSQPISDFNSISVKDMFLLPDNNLAAVRHFEKEWFGNTWYYLGSSRQSASVLIETQHDALSDEMIDEILRLHNFISKVRYHDKQHGGDISFRDVCKKSSGTENDLTTLSSCVNDPLIDILLCVANTDWLMFKTETKNNPGEVWGTMHMLQEAHNSGVTPSNSSSLYCGIKEKRIFVGESVGLVDDNEINIAAPTRAIRIKYMLQDETEGERTRSSFWLRHLDEEIMNFKSEHMSHTLVTTETLNSHWISLASFNVYYGVALCSLNFLALFIFAVHWENIFFGFFVAICGTVSLAMTLICMLSLHWFIFGIPTFNFPLCAILITVVQIVFQMVYASHYLTTQTGKREGQPSCEECFLESYEEAFLSVFAYWLLFTLCFASVTIPDSIPSFRNMCATCCIGYSLAFLYQLTYFPACVKVYEKWLRSPAERLYHAFRSKQNDFGPQTADLIENEQGRSSIRKADDDRRKTRKQKKKKNSKNRFETWINLYLGHVVSDYMRAIGALLYLTYVSCCYVGCLHFTERISPSQLVTMNDDVFKYYSGIQVSFHSFGPRFVVYGSFNGNPWDKDVLKQLFVIHQKLLQVDSVNSKLSTNWFQSYFNSTTAANHQEMSYSGDPTMEINDEEYDDPEKQFFDYDPPTVKPWYTEEHFSEEFWEEEDWKAAWKNFTNTAMFSNNYKNDLTIIDSKSLHPHHGRTLKSRARFRWIYQTSDVLYPGEREQLILSFSKISKEVDSSVISQLYFDSPEMDWWKSINANVFRNSFLCLLAFGLVAVLCAVAISKSLLVIGWSVMTCVSTTFGVCGIISFFSIGLDSFTLPCILFSLPFSIIVNINMLCMFTSGSGGGRAIWTKKAVKKMLPQATLYIVLLLFFNLVLSSRSSYAYHAPMISLLCLCFVAAIHFMLFLPVLLTVLPPSKKSTAGLPGKVPESSGNLENEEICAVKTDARPHLHARRFFYDSQRAASFRSEEDDSKIEHITCL